MAIYMKYGDVKGDATQQGHEEWINVNSFGWNVTWQITTRAGVRGNTRDAKHAKVDEITITKEADSASAPLLTAVCKSNTPELCTIDFVRTGDAGELFMKYIFHNALITQVQTQAARDADRPTEIIKINFTEVEMEVHRIDKSNADGPVRFFKFSVSEN